MADDKIINLDEDIEITPNHLLPFKNALKNVEANIKQQKEALEFNEWLKEKLEEKLNY